MYEGIAALVLLDLLAGLVLLWLLIWRKVEERMVLREFRKMGRVLGIPPKKVARKR